MSTQGYILQAVRKQMDGEPIPWVVENPESEPLTTEEPSCSVSPQLAEAIKEWKNYTNKCQIQRNP